MTKERGKQIIFFVFLFISPVTSVSSLSPPHHLSLPTSSSFHQSPSVSLTCTCTLTLTVRLQEKASTLTLHTPALSSSFSVCLARSHTFSFLKIVASGTPSCLPLYYLLSHPLCLHSSVSTWQTRFYICSCQTGRHLHLDYKFHFLSIHPPIRPSTPPFISFSLSLYPSISARRHECAIMVAYLHISHLDLSIFYSCYFFPPSHHSFLSFSHLYLAHFSTVMSCIYVSYIQIEHSFCTDEDPSGIKTVLLLNFCGMAWVCRCYHFSLTLFSDSFEPT